MIINKLQFQAFGPYPTKQTIDFDQINKNKIFLITGPTGAGKTTIFDAVSYALFSEATSKNRENKTLRSHHANENTETNVELIFTMDSKQYKIFRAPKQITLGRGGKLVEREAKVALTMPNGKVYEKAQDVEKELEKIFKLKSTQFKQIVMLAQGEFQKMLFASSNEREEIFRKVFGTEKIKEFQDELKKDLDNAKKEVAVKTAKLEEIIKLFELEEIPPAEYLKAYGEDSSFEKSIMEIIDNDMKREKELKITLQKLKEQIDEAIANQAQMIQLKKNFDELDKLQQEAKTLQNQKAFIHNIQETLSKINKLPLVDEYKKRVDNDHSQLTNLINTQNNLLHQKAIIMKAIQNIDKQLSASNEKKEKLVEAAKQKNYDALKPMLATLKNYDEEKDKIEKTKYELDSLNTNLINYYEKQNENQKTLSLIKIELEKTKETIDTEVEVNNRYLIVTQKYDDSCKLIADYEDYYIKYNQYLSYEKKYAEITNYISEIRKANIDLEAAKERNYLGIIASQIHDGNPCPLCGSTHHPNLAICDGVDYEEKIQENKNTLDEVTKQKDKIVEVMTTYKVVSQELAEKIQKRLESLQNELVVSNNLDMIKDYNQVIAKQKAELELAVSNIKQAKVLYKETSEQQQKQEITLNNIVETIKTYEVQKVVMKTTLETSISFVNKVESSLPSYYINAKELEKEITINEKMLMQISEEINNLTISKASNNATLVQLQETINNCDKDIKLMKSKYNESKEQFLNKIKEVFTSEEEYFKLINEKDNAKEYETKIDEYNKNVASNKALLTKVIVETDGKEEPDLNVIAEKLSNLQKMSDESNASIITLHNKVDTNKKNLRKYKEALTQAINADKHWAMIANLEEQASGRKTKVSFERYILSTSFEKMLMHASIRLKSMTNGRYTFVRREEKSGSASQGLDINIFDFKTSKERDVKSLSGGETFKASLALSLGLSDVIQQRIGSINIDTLFVDEGFGSLDSESLDSAIKTLYDIVKSGKVIGIISHVQEVKNRIESKIVISQTNIGSTISKIE